MVCITLGPNPYPWKSFFKPKKAIYILLVFSSIKYCTNPKEASLSYTCGYKVMHSLGFPRKYSRNSFSF